MKENCPDIDDGILNALQGGLPAVSLPSMAALNSAFCNDADPSLIYAQSLMSLATDKDLLIAISTSGNSKNVVNAAYVAKALGVRTIALTGRSGGNLKNLADVCICVPEEETYKVQELHLPIYHYLCAEIESFFFG
jgi:D-sedoheptulose 7-phosphate isomerase